MLEYELKLRALRHIHTFVTKCPKNVKLYLNFWVILIYRIRWSTDIS